jgi:hypothetical protein
MLKALKVMVSSLEIDYFLSLEADIDYFLEELFITGIRWVIGYL